MVETTHEALLRQTATAEELLTYFQGQRNQFQSDVSEARDDYAQLSADLISVVASEMRQTVYLAPDGDDSNDGKTAATAKATLEGARVASPDGCFLILRIASTEASPFEMTNVDFQTRNVEIRPANSFDTLYLRWRGMVQVHGGSIRTFYVWKIDYDGLEYSGAMTNAGGGSVALGGFYGIEITVKNQANLSIARADYDNGVMHGIFLGRVTLVDENGDPFTGTTSLFESHAGVGMASYELWQCSLGPNFVHSGTQIAANKYITG